MQIRLPFSDNDDKTSLVELKSLERFIQWFVTQSKLYLISTKTLLVPHKAAKCFSNNSHKMQVESQLYI